MYARPATPRSRPTAPTCTGAALNSMRVLSSVYDTLVRFKEGSFTQEPGLGQRNWDTSGIEDLLAEAGISAMEFVLRFTLSHPGLSTTIVGTANPGHLAGNIAIAEKGPLPADLYEEAKKLLPQ